MPDTKPLVHYSPPHKLAGDAVIACGAHHWQIVTERPHQVTCEPCKDPVAQAIANIRGARNKTSVNNPLNGPVDELLTILERMKPAAGGGDG